MLQQTRVDTVRPYFERFLERFPTPLALAEAPEDQVLAAWSGLGYYRRARMLHAGARAVGRRALPRTRDALLELPGIGPYTAGAIASIAFGERVGLVDGNVARVLARVFGIEDDMRKAGMKKAAALAEQLVAPEDPGAWNQALMELGATVCAPRNPACDRCPIAGVCRARAEGRVNELPVLSERKKPLAQSMQALVATRGERVLLGRRPSDGLFGGLWEPPTVEGRSPAKLAAALAVGPLRKKGRVVHVLSHRKLTIDVHVAELAGDALPARALAPTYEALALVSPEELDARGVSTLTRKVLSAALSPTVK